MTPKPILVEIKGKEMTLRCDSVYEAMEDASVDEATSLENLNLLRSSYKESAGKDFFNKATRESLKARLVTPDKAILTAIQNMVDSISETDPPTEVKRRRLRGVDFGDDINTDRFLAKNSMCWDRQQFNQRVKSVIWIGVNCVTICYQTPENLRWRGSAAIALADKLTQLGYSIGVYGIYHVTNLSSMIQHLHSRVIVKAPDAPMDVAALATSIADIGFARIVGMLGTARHCPGTLAQGLGRVNVIPENYRKGLDYLVDSDVITQEKALEWLRASLVRMSAIEEAEKTATELEFAL